MSAAGRSWRHRNDEELHALESFHDGRLVAAVDVRDTYAIVEFFAAVFARESSDSMFTGLQKSRCKVRSNGAASLRDIMSEDACEALKFADLRQR